MEEAKRAGRRVPGIGHRIKSRDNRDKRVELLQRYARKHFPATKHLDYAVAVEAVTLAKAANLVGVESCGKRVDEGVPGWALNSRLGGKAVGRRLN